jgi:hypothetical protein
MIDKTILENGLSQKIIYIDSNLECFIAAPLSSIILELSTFHPMLYQKSQSTLLDFKLVILTNRDSFPIIE